MRINFVKFCQNSFNCGKEVWITCVTRMWMTKQRDSDPCILAKLRRQYKIILTNSLKDMVPSVIYKKGHLEHAHV